MPVHTYPNPSSVPVHNNAVLWLWCRYNSQPAHLSEVIICFAELLYLEKRQRILNKVLKNWGPLSFNTYKGIPHGMTQLFKNIVAICVELILAIKIARVSFEKLSFIIMICWFPVVVFRNGPKVSIHTNSRVLQPGRAEPFACSSLEIHSERMSDILVKYWIHYSPCGAYEIDFACCSTYSFLGFPAFVG